MSDPPRTVGEWQLEALLGRGAMGEVWRARHPDGRVVALKLLVAGEHASPQALARFEREARAAAALTHPGVVRVLGTGGQDEQLRWIAMELVAGESLAARLARGRPPLAESLRIALELSQALEAAHAGGVVHRDLKPGNVLLDAAGHARLTDFGLAKVEREAGLTEPGALLGTPGYMAPEQAFGAPEEVGPRADVYGLGAVLYELLTGRPPHLAATGLALLRKLEEEVPAPPSTLASDVPRALDPVVLRALEKDPARRTPDARTLAEDLLRALAGELPAPVPAARPARGRLLALPALLLVVLVGAAALLRRDPLAPAREGLARAVAAPPAARREPVEAALEALRQAGPAASTPAGLALAEALQRGLGRWGAAARALEGAPPGRREPAWRRARDLLAAQAHQLAFPGLRHPELHAALEQAREVLAPPELLVVGALAGGLAPAQGSEEGVDRGARAEERLDAAAAAGAPAREVALARARLRLARLLGEPDEGYAARRRALEQALAALEPLRGDADPSEVHALEALGRLALGAPQAAREAADRLVAEAPAAAETWLVRALLQQEAGRWEQAREDLETAASLDPECDAPFLGVLLEAEETLAVRETVASEATWQAQLLAGLGDDPRPQAHLLRALVTVLREEWDEAERHLRAMAAQGGAPEVDWLEGLAAGLTSRGHLLAAGCQLLAHCERGEEALEAGQAALQALAGHADRAEARELAADVEQTLAGLLVEDAPDEAARHLLGAIRAGATRRDLEQDEELAPLLRRQDVRGALLERGGGD